MMKHKYIDPTQESGAALFRRKLKGPVVMLNLLKFKDIADYSANPDLAPEQPISGEEAFRLYIAGTLPKLEKSGGQLLFLGRGGDFFIGPVDEKWDMVMLVKQASVESFFAFAGDESYAPVLAHRTAAIEDARLLPMTELNDR